MIQPRNMEPMPRYFLIKIPKAAQKDKHDKLSERIYSSQPHQFMRREVQFGVIEKIGTEAYEFMPEASIGDYLLIHHFVSGKKDGKGHNFYLIDSDYEDDGFNYYMVNAFEFNGERNLNYGISKGTMIMPNRDYIFLEKDEDISTIDGIDIPMEVSSGGLFIPKQGRKSRSQMGAEMKKNMERCKQLSRNIPQDYLEEIMMRENPVKREAMEYSFSEIKKLEKENIRLSKELNKKKFELYKTAFVNPIWNEGVKESFGETINSGEMIYMLNIACHTEIDVFGKTYIVAESKYFGGSLKYMKEIITNYHATSHHRSATKKGTGIFGNKQNWH